MKVMYSRRALEELARIYDYLCSRSPHVASNVRGSIATTIARLAHLPLLGKLNDEPGVHVIIEPQYLYRVFYVIDADRVIVIRILHGSQG